VPTMWADSGAIPKDRSGMAAAIKRELAMAFLKCLNDRKAATAIEYALIATLISVAAIAAISALGDTVSNTFENVTTKMEN
jgi:pilus assembly protein Flp/PilA